MTTTTTNMKTITEQPNAERWIAFMADDQFFCPNCCPAGDYTDDGILILPVRPCDYVMPKSYVKAYCDVCQCELVPTTISE